jgi:hypothetical protein
MKHCLLFLICAAGINLAAQIVDERETARGNEKVPIGYFVKPYCEFGMGTPSLAVLPGISAGISVGTEVFLAATYKFMATENTPLGEADSRLYLDQQFAGIKGEYSRPLSRIAHLCIKVEAGIGHAELDLKDSYAFEQATVPGTDATFAYLEPGLTLGMDLWKYLRLDFSAGYRFASAVAFGGLADANFEGPFISVGARIGPF